MSTPESSRDITLQDDSGKSYWSALRWAMLPVLEEATWPTQLGSGLHIGSAEIAHLVLQSLIASSRAAGNATGIIFIDIKCAFAAMLRQLALPLESWEDVLLCFTKCGTPSDAVREVSQRSRTYKFWTNAGGTAMQLAVLTDAHRFSWMSMEGLSEVIEPTRGSLAGTPWADFVFAIVMLVIIRRIRAQLAREGITLHISKEVAQQLWGDTSLADEVICSDVSYVDDGTFVVSCCSSQLESQVERVISIIFEAFSSECMPLNMKRGKTSAILDFQGERQAAGQSCIYGSCSGV